MRGLSLGGDRLSQWGSGGTHLSIKLVIHPGCCGVDQTPELTDVHRDTKPTYAPAISRFIGQVSAQCSLLSVVNHVILVKPYNGSIGSSSSA